MAYYDFEKDRIVGAKPGTLVFAHELGHQFLERRFHFHSFEFNTRYRLILFSIIFLIAERRLYALVCVLVLIGLQAFGELFAWAYAFIRWWKQ